MQAAELRQYLSQYSSIENSFIFHSTTSRSTIDPRASVLFPANKSKNARIMLVGGCEFTFISHFLSKYGHTIYDTFENGVASDSISEFLGYHGQHAIAFDPEFVVCGYASIIRSSLLSVQDFDSAKANENKNNIKETIALIDESIKKIKNYLPSSKICIVSHISFSSRIFNFWEESTLLNYGIDLSPHQIAKIWDLELLQIAKINRTLFLDCNEIIGLFGKHLDGEELIRIYEYDGGHPEPKGACVLANTLHGWIQALWPSRKKIKVMVLDLDNTLWDGIYTEDGSDYISARLRKKYIDAAYYMACQGIIIAICSKNDPHIESDINKIFLNEYGYFWEKIISKKINWSPKSENIKEIADELNVGIDTIAFFDDQEFEREEVRNAHPSVRVFTDADLLQVPRLVDFMPSSPVSSEAKNRISSYRNEAVRRDEEKKFGSTQFEAFLISCHFELNLRRAEKNDSIRIFELLSRTNQQNITLLRTPLEFIEEKICNTEFDFWCCNLSDKFGNYGTIGAIIVDKETKKTAKMIEIGFSCRAMGKGIEKAFLQKILQNYHSEGVTIVKVNISITESNKGMIEIMKKVGFTLKNDDILVVKSGEADSKFDAWITWV
ncbi:MAG: HAD-IIIC family phosphatase [Clostridiaceae bacterium]|nr:HAD-IIIC family phosphatase [Clostridiaceae bacterium]